jgi:PAS domain S-box-containing protein
MDDTALDRRSQDNRRSADRRQQPLSRIILSNERRKTQGDRRRLAAHESVRELNADRAELFLPASEFPAHNPTAPQTLEQLLQHARLELEFAHDHYQALYHHSPVGYISINREGFIVDVNASAARLLEGGRQQFIDTLFADLVQPHDLERWQRLLAALQEGKTSPVRQRLECGITRVTGSPFIAQLDCLRLTAPHKGVSLLLTITDISQVKQLEHCPFLNAQAFDLLEGIVVTNAQKIILQVNQAFTRLTGFSSEEAIGQTPQKLLHSGLQSEYFYQRMWHAIVHQGYWQGEISNRRKNGEIFAEWLTISAILDVSGQANYYVGSFVELDSHKHLLSTQDDTQTLATQLQQKNAELAQVKSELSNVNTALRELLQQQKTDYADVSKILEQKVNQEILPFLQQLKDDSHTSKELALLKILEANLQKIIAADDNNQAIKQLFKKLTLKEIQVASMIRLGLSSKQIAAALLTSTETINVHRKNIRKKLGLDNQEVNLSRYFSSFD